jgi:hypothetical protein
MLNSSGEPLTLSGFFVGTDTPGPGSSSASSGNANPNPLTSQTGVGSIGSSIGAPPIGLFGVPSPSSFGDGIRSWSSSVAPISPLYAAPPAPPSDQAGGVFGMLLDHLRDNPNR